MVKPVAVAAALFAIPALAISACNPQQNPSTTPGTTPPVWTGTTSPTASPGTPPPASPGTSPPASPGAAPPGGPAQLGTPVATATFDFSAAGYATNVPPEKCSQINGAPGPDQDTLETGDAGKRVACGVING